MSNPFDAAIEELKWILDTTKLDTRREQISAAIRVLEAATKVDKLETLLFLHEHVISTELWDFISALPDAPAERKRGDE